MIMKYLVNNSDLSYFSQPGQYVNIADINVQSESIELLFSGFKDYSNFCNIWFNSSIWIQMHILRISL